MKNYKITINGKTYDVGVEESGSGAAVKSVQPAPASKPAPAPKAAPAGKPAPAPKAPAGSGDVTAPLAGNILSIAVTEGQEVTQGQLLLVFEAMKMENEIAAPCAGTVKKIHISKGDAIEAGALCVSIG